MAHGKAARWLETACRLHTAASLSAARELQSSSSLIYPQVEVGSGR
jgi:hypothetical protein